MAKSLISATLTTKPVFRNWRRCCSTVLISIRCAAISHHLPVSVVESRSYYGKGYQDVAHRKPSIDNAGRCLGWEPSIAMRDTVEETLDFFLRSVDIAERAS